MSESPPYTPPKIWTWDKESGGRFTVTKLLPDLLEINHKVIAR